MGDKIIKINSVQGFSASFDNNTPPTVLNNVDFVIPKGMTVSWEKSYVSFSTQINSTDNDATTGVGVYNNNLYLQVDGQTPEHRFNCPNSTLIRNAHMTCTKGQVESIRRVDSLSMALWGVSKNAEDKKSDMNTFGDFANGRGVGQRTSYFLDCVVNELSPDGLSTGEVSRQIARDIKVPIKDIFNGIGQATDWSTDVFGETRLSMETNWKNVKQYPLGGNERDALSFDNTNAWGAINNIDNIANGVDVTEVVSTVTYTPNPQEGQNWEYNCPFFIGCKVELTGQTATDGAGTGITPITGTVNRVITSIARGANGALTFTLNGPLYTNATGAPAWLSELAINALIDQTNTIVVNSAQLVLYTVDTDTPTQSYDYVTYTTEEDNGNNLDIFSRQYLIEPSCVNLLVLHAHNGSIIPSKVYEDYRISIDNVDQTSNRSVVLGSSLQYDRLLRCLQGNAGIPWRNAQMKFYRNSELQSAVYTGHPITLIAETTPVTAGMKKIELQINTEAGGGVHQLMLFKQISKSI